MLYDFTNNYVFQKTDRILQGRIISEPVGKLNSASIHLQQVNGVKIRLQFNETIKCSLFPGQSVCIKGSFLNQNLFIVDEIVYDAPLHYLEMTEADVGLKGVNLKYFILYYYIQTSTNITCKVNYTYHANLSLHID